MKVLWLSNVPFPDVCKELKIPIPVVGGWMYAGALALLKTNKNIKLAVACGYSGKELQHITQYEIDYFLFPNTKKGNVEKLESYFKQINELFAPDISHIHGTEYLHSLAYANIADNNKLVVSIQGLVSVYALYYLGGIPEKDVKKTITFRDVIRNDSLFKQKINMEKRGAHEMVLLKKIRHVIGRTSWDYANVWALNPDVKYHFCNESLRAGFYEKKWTYESCEPHTIFLSQAHYPIKGLQQVIKALPLVLNLYPNAKIYIAGNNFIGGSKLRKNGFANYIIKLMESYKVSEKIHFLGLLSEEQMVAEYLKANVFVCPSAIENSPNSIGEAQLLGTPVIASYTGGTMDMVSDGKTGFLYRFEETTLLAKRICKLFNDPKKCVEISENARAVAGKRHDRANNSNDLVNIYKKIIEC